MYIMLVRQIVEEAVSTFADDNGLSESEVLRRIWEHVDHTASEHSSDEPSIDYEDPLCRLGYLYRHAAANATLFENVLTGSDDISRKFRDTNQGVLNICAVGGGPGTELLGIAKYLTRQSKDMPRKIAFTVVDNVSHWAETWQHLADVVEGWFDSSSLGVNPPIFAPAFLRIDGLDSSSYRNYSYQFRKADIVVCNYLFSENKSRLSEARPAVKRLHKLTPSGCVFVVIDRRENNRDFEDRVVDLFESVFGHDIVTNTYNGTIDGDEQASDMGEELIGALGYPRIKFFTQVNRDPTVFWFVAKQE